METLDEKLQMLREGARPSLQRWAADEIVRLMALLAFERTRRELT